MRFSCQAIVVCLLGLCAGTVDANSSWAFVKVDQQEHDFGYVERGTKMSHTFTLTNVTDQEVRIKGVRVSCGCVDARTEDIYLSPGASTKVHAKMDTSRFQGSKSVMIYVEIDRPRHSSVSMRLAAVSQANVTAGTSEMDFGVVPLGASITRKLNLDYSGNNRWAITKLDCPNPHLKAAYREIERSSNRVRYELAVTVLGSNEVGAIEQPIRLTTNDSEAPSVLGNVHAKVESRVVVTPEVLHVGQPSSGQQVTKNVIIKAGTPFRILRAENTSGLFEVKSSPDPKTAQLVVVTLTMPEGGAVIPDHIDLVTDLPEDGTISLSIEQ